jgi:hypothetical protein
MPTALLAGKTWQQLYILTNYLLRPRSYAAMCVKSGATVLITRDFYDTENNGPDINNLLSACAMRPCRVDSVRHVAIWRRRHAGMWSQRADPNSA